jgi:hypothetical protein
MLVERTDLHIGWLAAPATQVPLGVTEDVVRHECSHQPIEGVSKDVVVVEACVGAVADGLTSMIIPCCSECSGTSIGALRADNRFEGAQGSAIKNALKPTAEKISIKQ